MKLKLGLSTATIIRWFHKLPPIRMILPHHRHFFNRNTFGLRQKLVNKQAHHHHKKCKEDEESKLHVAQHGGENLSNGKCENHVNRNIDTLGRWSHLKWKNFTWHQPSKRTPRPCESHHIHTYAYHNKQCIPLRKLTWISINSKFRCNGRCYNNLCQNKYVLAKKDEQHIIVVGVIFPNH